MRKVGPTTAVAAVGVLAGGCHANRRLPPSAPHPTQRAALPAAAAKTESPAFVDVAQEAGLGYQWSIPGKRPLNILQGVGNGCAFLDYNGDGNLDILLVGTHPALFRGDGAGHFADVTGAAGLNALAGHFLGCAVGDYDNDGYLDIYLSAYHGGALLHNEEGKGFREVTAVAGLQPQPWGSSCTFVDADGDGRLDLYVGNYVLFGPETKPQLCDLHGLLSACGPAEYPAARGVMYQNRGGGRFQDVTRAWGLDRATGKALGVAAAPDGSIVPSLAIANDQVAGDLFQLKGGPCENRGIASGMAFMGNGHVYAGMGIDWGDYNNDGHLDLVVATYQSQAKLVFRNSGGLFTAEDAARIGMSSSVPFVAFGAKWLDFDNDGWLDLFFTNGHVQDNIADVDLFYGPEGGAVYRQPCVLYHNARGERFEDQRSRLTGGAERRIVGRGLATGDYDNDGRVDVLAVDSEGKPLLLHNVTRGAGAWLLVQLVGRRSNHDGYGALLTVEAAGRKITRHCHADGSYLSSSDPRVHFGLGGARTIERLTVRWPDGHNDVYSGVAVNQRIMLREGDRAIHRQPGRNRSE